MKGQTALLSSILLVLLMGAASAVPAPQGNTELDHNNPEQGADDSIDLSSDDEEGDGTEGDDGGEVDITIGDELETSGDYGDEYCPDVCGDDDWVEYEYQAASQTRKKRRAGRVKVKCRRNGRHKVKVTGEVDPEVVAAAIKACGK